MWDFQINFFFFFFFFFEIVFSHNQKFLGSKQAPRYTGKRVILMRVLTRLECTIIFIHVYWYMQQISGERLQDHWSSGFAFFLSFFFYVTSSRHLTCVGRQIDVRLQRHNNVGVRLILKVCLLSKLDVNLMC